MVNIKITHTYKRKIITIWKITIIRNMNKNIEKFLKSFRLKLYKFTIFKQGCLVVSYLVSKVNILSRTKI